MVKRKSSVRAVTGAARAAGLIARKFPQLETEASKVMAEGERSFKMASAVGRVSALIKAPGLPVQFENGQFAVDLTAKEQMK